MAKSYGLHLFCDLSKDAYGFVAYCCDDNDVSNFLFAKAKVTAIKNYSIPNLELLAVSLLFKCLPALLAAYSNINFHLINVCTDSQIVLGWLLKGASSVKNKFVKNRLSKISVAKDEIFKTYNLKITFK